MPRKPPPLPGADDLPEMEVDDSFDDGWDISAASADRMNAEAEVSESLEDISVHSFEDISRIGPLNFDDGRDMGRHAH